jgi:putative sterol carrier protein
VAHEFLSDEWFAAVEALGPPPAASGPDLGTINIVVTRSDGDDVEIHLARGTVARGLAEDAATTITTSHDVAKAVFLKGDQQAAMQAFMAGQVKVEGDMTKLMAMGSSTPTPEQKTYARAILELTRT